MPLTRIKNKGLGDDVSFENINDTGTEGTKVAVIQLLKEVVQLVNGDIILKQDFLKAEIQMALFLL